VASPVSANKIALGAEALEDAREAAFELFCIAGATFPEEWCGSLPRLLIRRAVYFAISARRVHEIMQINPNDVGAIQSFVAPDAHSLELEPDYRVSLNALIHAKDASVVVAGTNRHLFVQNQNKAVGGIDVLGDDGSMRRVNVYGLAVDFLIRVVPLALQWIAVSRQSGIPPGLAPRT
jgi:hypothetical protein